MKEQEAEVMENFPERFYHSPHVQPPVQTKVHLDSDKLRQNTPGAGAAGGNPEPRPLSEEDRKLEERLRKLKESHKSSKPAYSESVLQDRLAKLRDEPESGSSKSSGETNIQTPLSSTTDNQTQSSGLAQQPSDTTKTQTEQADDLMSQASDRVKLDSRIEQAGQHQEDHLHSRFQALTGKNTTSSSPPPHSQLEDSITAFLSGMEVQIEDEDPEKLLGDFKKFQAKEEQLALADVTSCDVQALVQKARELQQQEQGGTGEGESENIITSYPQLPDSIVMHGPEGEEAGEDQVSQTEISKVLEAAQKEMEQEEREEKDVDRFVSETSQRLEKLRGEEKRETESDCEVRSKPEPKQKLELPDFSWNHFGGSRNLSSSLNRSTGSTGQEETAARQLGIMLSGEVLDSGEVGSDEVANLIKRTMEEAALDRKLEEKGLDRYLESHSKPDQPTASPEGSGKGVAVASGSSGACAVTNYPSSSTAASGWGYSDDMPWCCICNEDAQIRCYDCDNDLYCTRCFSEGHEQFGLFDHKYAPFEPLSSRAV